MSEFDGNVISGLIKKTYLGGAIEECLLVIKGGKAHIQAIDKTNSMCVEVSSKIDSDKDAELGLNNLNILQKYLEKTKKPVKYTVKKEKLSLIKSNKERITILMMEKDAVMSVPKSKLDIKAFNKNNVTSFKCKRKLLDKIDDYISLLNLESVTISVSGTKVAVSNGSLKEKGFSIPKAAKAEKKVKSEISTQIFAKHFTEVLKATLEDKDAEVEIHVGNNSPLVIKQGKNFWALLPIG